MMLTLCRVIVTMQYIHIGILETYSLSFMYVCELEECQKLEILIRQSGVRRMPEFILTFSVRECRYLVVKWRTTN